MTQPGPPSPGRAPVFPTSSPSPFSSWSMRGPVAPLHTRSGSKTDVERSRSSQLDGHATQFGATYPMRIRCVVVG